MSHRRPCLTPIRESSLSLSLLRSDSTTLDEPPYRVRPPVFVGTAGGLRAEFAVFEYEHAIHARRDRVIVRNDDEAGL